MSNMSNDLRGIIMRGEIDRFKEIVDSAVKSGDKTILNAEIHIHPIARLRITPITETILSYHNNVRYREETPFRNNNTMLTFNTKLGNQQEMFDILLALSPEYVDINKGRPVPLLSAIHYDIDTDDWYFVEELLKKPELDVNVIVQDKTLLQLMSMSHWRTPNAQKLYTQILGRMNKGQLSKITEKMPKTPLEIAASSGSKFPLKTLLYKNANDKKVLAEMNKGLTTYSKNVQGILGAQLLKNRLPKNTLRRIQDYIGGRRKSSHTKHSRKQKRRTMKKRC
jgi:hypothetical protein